MPSRVDKVLLDIQRQQSTRHALYAILAIFGVAGWLFAEYSFVLLALLAIAALAIRTPIEDAKRLKEAEEHDRAYK